MIFRPNSSSDHHLSAHAALLRLQLLLIFLERLEAAGPANPGKSVPGPSWLSSTISAY